MISSGLKEKTFYVTKEYRGKKNTYVCLFLLFENSRPLSPPQKPQTPLSFLGTPDFLSTCLGIDSLSSVQFSHSVVSNSLQPHGLQHARPP